MNRRIFMSTVVLSPLVKDPFLDNAIDFNIAWNDFFRPLLGCPEHAKDAMECRPITGVRNFKLFEECRKQAMKFFKLGEPNAATER